MEPSDELVSLVSQAVAMKDAKALRTYTHRVIMHIIEEDSFPDPIFTCLTKILNQSDFQCWQSSVLLLKVFEDTIEYLTDLRKSELLDIFEKTFHNYTDSTSCLLIAELVGALFRDQRSLNALQGLKKTKKEMPRALVPAGLEYFAMTCQNQSLSEEAKKALLEMRSDPSQMVRDEAEQSIRRLTR